MYCEGLSVQEVCSSGKEREDNKEGTESGKPKGGHEGIRDPVSLALLSPFVCGLLQTPSTPSQ